MLHRRDAADIEVAGERAHANARALFHHIEHAPAALVGQRLKYGIHIVVIKHVTEWLPISSALSRGHGDGKHTTKSEDCAEPASLRKRTLT